MEDNDSCLPGRCAEQCATTVLQKRSRHPSTCWGKVALLASWGVMTLCLLWWNFCSRLEKNVLCRAGMIVIHDFHICLLMWKLRAPGFARTTCFSAKKWNHGFQRERSWCNSCLSCPEETKGFLSERVARKTAYCRRTPKGASRGWSFLSWKKNSVRVRDVQSDLENWNQMKSGIFMHVLLASLLHLWCKMDGMILDASCTGTFASATKGSQGDSITVILELLSFLQDELERTFSGAPFWNSAPGVKGLHTLQGNNWFRGYCFLAHWEFTCPMSSFPAVLMVSVQWRATFLFIPCTLLKNWSCITFETAWAYFRSCVAFLGCWCCCGAKCQVGLRGSAGSAPAVRRWNAISFAPRLSRPQEMQHTSISVWEWYRCWKQAGPFWVNLLEIVCHGRLEPGQRWQALWFLCSWPLFG